MDRRTFMLTSSAGLFVKSRSSAAMAAEAGRVPVIDTHLHCFAGKDDSRFPYHPHGLYRAYRMRLLAHLVHLSAADQAKVMGGNAARLFGFRALVP